MTWLQCRCFFEEDVAKIVQFGVTMLWTVSKHVIWFEQADSECVVWNNFLATYNQPQIYNTPGICQFMYTYCCVFILACLYMLYTYMWSCFYVWTKILSADIAWHRLSKCILCWNIIYFPLSWRVPTLRGRWNLIQDQQLEAKCGRLGHQRNQSQTLSWTATQLARIFARGTFEICQAVFGLHAKGQTYQKGLLAGHSWLYATGLELDETWKNEVITDETEQVEP